MKHAFYKTFNLLHFELNALLTVCFRFPMTLINISTFIHFLGLIKKLEEENQINSYLCQDKMPKVTSYFFEQLMKIAISLRHMAVIPTSLFLVYKSLTDLISS